MSIARSAVPPSWARKPANRPGVLRSSRRVLLAGLAAVAMVSASALAQNQPGDGAFPRPPRAQQPDSPIILNLGMAVVITSLVILAAILPSKRSHQD